ncbi:glutathione S-transferase family protein [Pararhodospirillum photometricum]|uniref:Glutathione-S-transferase n=1 Tax=Pararhodospirillum photometricum DSM 122 TaxID=1150469 RepID=H6SMQ2_PARPM|nr:glutathione S-transferase family protein [Pararhodospirillum photometricum]CCG09187.1 Glutathione-S-transferase [Pararhodospirillum photometricum DSM 122]
MIDLYTSPTPNGRKVSILLEELGLPYTVHAVDLAKGEQRAEAFLALNTNGKIPVIVDGPVVLAESGAILVYLAEKTGSPLLPTDPVGRAAVWQSLMFQMSGLGPTWGQVYYFSMRAPEPNPAALERFLTEANRQTDVLEAHLSRTPWVAGEHYTIADIAFYPWIVLADRLGIPLETRPALRRWRDTLTARPAVTAGMAVPA